MVLSASITDEIVTHSEKCDMDSGGLNSVVEDEEGPEVSPDDAPLDADFIGADDDMLFLSGHQDNFECDDETAIGLSPNPSDPLQENGVDGTCQYSSSIR
jgi:hypothetical protein